MVQTSMFRSVGAAAAGDVSNGNILDRAVLLSLSIHRWGTAKKVQQGEVTSDASPEMLRVSKKIIKSAEYDNIVKADGGFTRLLGDLALPSMFRAGVYAVPLALVERVDSEMSAYMERRGLLISEFIRAYQGAVSEAEALLGSLYDVSNYPDGEAVRARFYVDYKYVSTSVPEKLNQIRRDIFERESARAHQEVESMTENIKAVLRQAVRDLLSHAVDKLKPKADGTQQIFRDSLVVNIRSFLETFQARNIADDGALAEICGQIDGLLAGVTPDALRSDADLRAEVRTTFEGITASLDAMLVDRPGRKLRRVEVEAGVSDE